MQNEDFNSCLEKVIKHVTAGNEIKAEETETGAIKFYIGDPVLGADQIKEEIVNLEARLHEIEVQLKASEEDEDVSFLKRDRLEIMAKLEALKWVLDYE